MKELSPLFIVIALILLLVIAILYLRIRRFNLAMDKIVTFANSFLSGDFKRLSLPEDINGRVSSALNAMASDITNRISETAEERGKIDAVLKCMTDGILITDTKARVILANPAIKTLLNIKTDIIGESVIVATRVTDIHNIVMKVIETEDVVSEEIDIPLPNELCLMATAVPLHSYEVKEGISGVVLSLHDITRLKRLETIRKDFIANVSHELKTPITAIRGFAETLLIGALEDRENAMKFLKTIKSHSERLNSLIDDLLTLSKIELEVTRIEKKTVDMNEVIDVVFTTLADKAASKGLYLRRSVIQEPAMISADRDKLIQILLNLVDNGIKFTETGGVTVGMGKRDDKLMLFVEDTGVGIPKNHIERLGERFYRVDRARSRELGGTGLGLAIVKHLVKAHGWNMSIESILGSGTTVKILIL